jgi:hypothetical protein
MLRRGESSRRTVESNAWDRLAKGAAQWWRRLARKFAVAMQELQLQKERGRSLRLSPEI